MKVDKDSEKECTDRLKLDNKRIEDAKKRIAKCLNMLETTASELKWACEFQHWNDEVAYQIEEASTKLGYALATLERWNDDFDPAVDN